MQAPLLISSTTGHLCLRQHSQPTPGDLAAKDAIFRIHNDMRFAKNQARINKMHISAVLAPGGWHSLWLPYYIHIMPGGSLLAGGVHMPTYSDLQGHSLGDPRRCPSALASPLLQTL